MTFYDITFRFYIERSEDIGHIIFDIEQGESYWIRNINRNLQKVEKVEEKKDD